ncbi:MAG: thioredoxin-disulfide reductase [Chloroflexi bacterium]|nr:thioredoxin-disulfide reductase [Chloroflexota bacterium]
MYDVVIIGGGPAGLTAGIYAARDRQKAILLEKAFTGGQIVNSEKVENYPGFPAGISGFELSQLFREQAIKAGLEIIFAEVIGIEVVDKIKTVFTTEGKYLTRGIIIAGGSEHNHLNVPGEEIFSGRGVSYCATCDGAFFKEKVVAIVGGGDSAVSEALSLANYASKVYLIHQRDALRAMKVLQDRAFSNPKIEFKWNTQVLSIKGNNKVNTINLLNIKTGEEYILEVSGVFIAIGSHAVTGYLKGMVSLDNGGYIITNDKMETNVPGVYAAGDIRSKVARQVVTAAGDGATAAWSLRDYLTRN